MSPRKFFYLIFVHGARPSPSAFPSSFYLVTIATKPLYIPEPCLFWFINSSLVGGTRRSQLARVTCRRAWTACCRRCDSTFELDLRSLLDRWRIFYHSSCVYVRCEARKLSRRENSSAAPSFEYMESSRWCCHWSDEMMLKNVMSFGHRSRIRLLWILKVPKIHEFYEF